MKKYLVIGNPIEHSLSPLIHNYWIKKYGLMDIIYEKIKIEEKDLINIVNKIKDNEIAGVNVTVPFKKTIIPLLDGLDNTAKLTESVNTLVLVNKELIGFNTDKTGFLKTIENFSTEKNLSLSKFLNGKKILILGAGGVTPSIISAFNNNNVKIYLTNRTKDKANMLKQNFNHVEILDWEKKLPTCDIVINTTSVGLKKNDNINLNFENYNNDQEKLFYDLIYNPKETNFLKEARLRGNKTINGKMMFLNQAAEAFKIWTNILPEIDNETFGLF